MKRVLFLCGRNRWRSPTAENIFAGEEGVVCMSAGFNQDADQVVTPELVDWADLIFVMERQHKAKLTARFRSSLRDQRVICLDIPDRYRFMDPKLVGLLEAKVRPHLERAL